MSLLIFLTWISNYIVVLTFPYFLHEWGMQSTFTFYAVIGLLALLFFWFCVPETKGKSLEEIERSFFRKR